MPSDSRDTPILADAAQHRLQDFLQQPAIQRIYVHDTEAVGVDSLNVARGSTSNVHAGRAVLLAQRGDLVVVPGDIDPAYLGFLDGIGIGPGREGVFVLPTVAGRGAARSGSLLAGLREDRALRMLAERTDPRREFRLSPYYASAGAFETAAALQDLTGRRVAVDGGSPEAVALSNRKDLVREQACRLGIPWSTGELVGGPGRGDGTDLARELHAAIGRVRASTGGAFVRGVWSMHGADNLRVTGRGTTVADLAEWLRGRASQQAFLVEPLLSVRASPNVQLWIEDDGSVHALAVTAQRLDENLVHRGNAFPYRSPWWAQIRAWSVAMGRWLSTVGYRGPLGLDFLETTDPRTGREITLLVEVNGRINGATYALGVTERLDQQRAGAGLTRLGFWRSATEVATSARSFADLAERLDGLLFADFRRSAGVIPYNAGLLPHGLVYLLMVASGPDELDDLEAAARARTCGG